MTTKTQQILETQGLKKHEIIFALNQIGLTNSEIVTATGFPSGRVSSDLRYYVLHPERVEKFNSKYSYLVS